MAHGNYQSDLSLDEKLMMGLVRNSEMFKKKASEIFKNFGLTFAQYNVLRVLSSSDEGVNTISNLSKIILVTGANMTGLSKRMARDGYLLRKNHPTDERVTLLEITPKGRQALQNIEPEKDLFISGILEDLTTQNKEEILAFLRSLAQRTNGK